MSSVGKSCGSMVKKLAGVATAYVSVREAVSFAKDSLELYNQQAKAEARLNELMMNVQGTTEESVNSVKKYAAELQNLTTIGDEVTIQGASQLATFKLQGDTIKTLLPSLQNLAVSQYGVSVSGDQMQQMANLVGKVMTGNVGALTRYGVTLDDTQKKLLKNGTESQKAAVLVDVLKQNFGDLAQTMAQTDEGKVIQLKNAWGDVKEEIGGALMPVVSEVVSYLSNHIPQIRDFITNAVDKAKPILESALSGAKKGFELVGDAVKWAADNWNWLCPVLKVVAAIIPVVTAAQWALNVAMTANPIGIIVVAIGVLIGMIALLVIKWDDFVAYWGRCIDWLCNMVDSGLGIIKQQFITVWDGITGFLSSAWDTIYNGATNIFGKLGSAVSSVWDGIVGVVKGAINGIIKGINSMISGAVSGINKLIDDINAVSGAVGIPAIPTLTAPQIPLLANGGIIRRGGDVIVGERGPEMLRLPRGAQVVPLPAGATAGGNTYQNTFYVKVNASDRGAAENFVKRVKEILDNM